jgi:aldehyde dehydrogenase (NAD+)
MQDERSGSGEVGPPGPADRSSAEAAARVVARLRASFEADRTRPVAFRLAQLEGLRRLLDERERELLEALRADLGKPAVEGWLTDIGFVAAEVDLALRHLAAWARPRRVPVPAVQRPSRAYVLAEPLGVVAVIAPWNYPVHLALLPTVAAIAAGNCVVVKPSELAPATSEALASLLPRYLDEDAVAVLQGGPSQTEALLDQRLDHVFYTGNGRVGRIVMEKAARQLTPVTLELGGKSPAIVDRDADLEVAARRIAWGKFTNAGQTCVAPDYVLVHREVERELVDALVTETVALYGRDPRQSPDYGRIVNDRHLRRLQGLLEGGGYEAVALGGEADEATRYLAPTVLTGVEPDAPVMQEEIFGPILPVLGVADLGEAVEFVRARPKPLALYVFTRSKAAARSVLERTSSGGACVNGTVRQLAVPGLPFGGVGESGMGAYHGRHGFDALSHHKAVLELPSRPDVRLAYPPYTRLRRLALRLALSPPRPRRRTPTR